MTDISISIDETLELDAIIEEWSGSDSIVDLNGDKSSFNISGIQTKTSILDPQETGNYTITINGQDLSVEVTGSDTIIENAETGDVYSNDSEEVATYYHDDRSDITPRPHDTYKRSTTQVHSGTYSISSNGSRQDIVSLPGGSNNQDLPTYPEPGDTFQVWWVPQSGDSCTQSWFGWGQDSYHLSDSGYSIATNSRYSNISLREHIDSSTYNTLDSTSSSGHPQEKWVKIEIDWGTDDTITVEFYEDGSKFLTLSGQSSFSADKGGFGFGTREDNRKNTYWDDIKII